MPQTSRIEKQTVAVLENAPLTGASSILGFYALTIAVFMAAVGLARGNVGLPYQDFVGSAAIFFSGLAVMFAGLWAVRTRDILATALFGVWGSFLLGYGSLFLFAPRINGAILMGMPTSIGFWMVPLAVITWTMAIAAVRVNIAAFAVLVMLGFGAAIGAVGFFSGISAVLIASGWVFIFASLAILWTASSLFFEAVMGYSPLPLFRREPAPAYRETEEHIIVEGR